MGGRYMKKKDEEEEEEQKGNARKEMEERG